MLNKTLLRKAFRGMAVAASVLIINEEVAAQAADLHAIEGRWDMNLMIDGKPQPSWLEVVHSGTKRLVGSYVGISGSARPVSKILFKDNKVSFSLPPQWEEEENDLSFEGTFQGDSLSGSMT